MHVFTGTQLFYLVDEAQGCGKGANSVASMLHHHLEYRSYGETDVCFHMDNCSGQNKNNTVIGYSINIDCFCFYRRNCIKDP